MERVTTIAEMRARAAQVRAAGRRLALVPTMGALHAGHLSLVSHARGLADVVVVSIFVNPTQFAPGEDLDAYPRDLAGDEARLADLGDDAPDLVFAPTATEMYPQGSPLTTVVVSGITDRLCGVSRPTHFHGVATVVSKLHAIVTPDVAVYGRKDFQQLRVVQQVAHDLNQPVDVVGGPTVREPDGLAMSSRNLYLDDADREAATVLSRALRAAVEQAGRMRAAGDRLDPGMIREAADVTLRAEPRIRIDYVDVLDAATLAPPDAPRGQAPGPGPAGSAPPLDGEPRLLVAVAAHLGSARLIDNVVIGDLDDEERLLAATDG